MNLTKKVTKKLEDYGLKIYKSYETEENEFVIYSEDMILFVNEIEDCVSITFQATTRPEVSASLVLILSQIKETIHIMEPFIFDQDNNFISGNKAYKLIDTVNKENILKEYKQEQAYTNLLNNIKCHEC